MLFLLSGLLLQLLLLLVRILLDWKLCKKFLGMEIVIIIIFGQLLFQARLKLISPFGLFTDGHKGILFQIDIELFT